MAFRTGSRHLVGGQVLDLEGEGRELTVDELRAIHHGKTSALIIASVRLGGMSAGCTQEQLDALTEYGRALGLAFQIIDDILDVTSTDEVLGKNIGSDKDKNKTTFMKFFTPESAKAYAEKLTDEAIVGLDGIEHSDGLVSLALYLCDREA